MKRWVWIAVIIPAAGFVVAVAIIRGMRTATPEPKAPQSAAASVPNPSIYIPPSKPQAPAPPTVVARAMDEAAFRSTYDDYRTAVATKNSRMQAKLLPRLLKEKDLAISYAERELREAKAEFDREVATKVLESLQR